MQIFTLNLQSVGSRGWFTTSGDHPPALSEVISPTGNGNWRGSRFKSVSYAGSSKRRGRLLFSPAVQCFLFLHQTLVDPQHEEHETHSYFLFLPRMRNRKTHAPLATDRSYVRVLPATSSFFAIYNGHSRSTKCAHSMEGARRLQYR